MTAPARPGLSRRNRRFRRPLRSRKAAAGLAPRGGRPGDAGLGDAQARNRAALCLSAGIGRGRQKPGAIFDHRPVARSGLALQGRPRRNQPRGEPASARPVRAGRRRGDRFAARTDRRKPDRTPPRIAADGERAVRLSGLRHDQAGRAPALGQSGHLAGARCGHGAAGHRADLRFDRTRRAHRHPGLAAPGRVRRRPPRPRRRARIDDIVATLSRSLPATPIFSPVGRQRRAGPAAGSPTPARPNIARSWTG